MNFFAALSIFRIITPGVDITVLPMVATNYVLDSADRPVAREQSLWHVKSPGLLENIQLSQNSETGKIDTSMNYIGLDADNNPVRFTALPNEAPIQNGAEFVYAGNVLKQRLQYAGGQAVYTTNYQYSNGNLVLRVTADSLGPVDTTRYAYVDGKLTEIETHLGSGYLKTKFTYQGADSILSKDYDVDGAVSSVTTLWILKNGLIQNQIIYENSKLVRFTLYEYPSTTSLASSRPKSRPAGKTRDWTRDALGRQKPYLTVPATGFSAGRNFRNR